jgi:hypothetical protein
VIRLLPRLVTWFVGIHDEKALSSLGCRAGAQAPNEHKSTYTLLEDLIGYPQSLLPLKWKVDV